MRGRGEQGQRDGYNEATKNTNQCDWIELNFAYEPKRTDSSWVWVRVSERERERNRNRNNNKNTNKAEKNLKLKRNKFRNWRWRHGPDQSTERWLLSDGDDDGDCDGGSRPDQTRPNRKANAKMPNLLPAIRQKSLRHQKLLQMRDAPLLLSSPLFSSGTSSHGRIAQSASQHFAKNISMITQWTIGWNGNASNRVAVAPIVVAPIPCCCGRVQQNHNKRLEQRTWATKRARERGSSVEQASKKSRKN